MHGNSTRWVGLIGVAVLLACGSSSTSPGSGGGGAGGEGATATTTGGSGGAGGMAANGGGGADLATGAGPPACSERDESGEITFDGVTVPIAQQTLQVAPGTPLLTLCFMLPGDDLDVCSQQLTIGTDDLAIGVPQDDATVGGEHGGQPLSGEPGFTVTYLDSEGLAQEGTFAGDVTDASGTYAVSGTFAVCAASTE